MNASPTESVDRPSASLSRVPGAGPFVPGDAVAFRFGTEHWTPETGVVVCSYQLRMRTGEVYSFAEHYRFPVLPSWFSDDASLRAVRRVLRLLHLVAGVSYYKAACPRVMEFDTPPDAADADFLQRLYVQGLGEYADVNGFDIRTRVTFAPSTVLAHIAPSVPWIGSVNTRRWLVPIGGGKDSFLSASLLHEFGEPHTPFVLGSNRVVRAAALEVSAYAGTDPVFVDRTIDPRLLDLNARGALNGHIPITAIVSLAAIGAALLTGHDAVAMSNERSANTGEVIDHAGHDVNHQHSKSLAFERDLRARLHDVPVEYVSLLRPLSELSICRAFAARQERLAAFSSCNGNFRIGSASHEPAPRWCNACPKCRFVCLALAPWLDRATLAAIFGSPPILDDAQLDEYRALLGAPGTVKPFECVGQIDESRAAVELLLGSPSWRDTAVARWYAENLRPTLPDPRLLVQAALTTSHEHELPAPLFDAISRAVTPPSASRIYDQEDGAQCAPR